MTERERLLEEAVRFLWRAWSEAEGDEQPRVAVFGDAELDAYRRELGEEVPPRAPREVQDVIADVVR